MKVSASNKDRADLLNPGSDAWSDASSETVSLSPVPLEAQPNEYIRSSRADRAYGSTGEATASALVAGDDLFVRVEWQEAPTTSGEFSDAAGILLGSGDELSTLGADDNPLDLWLWTDGRECQSFASRGPGVFSRTDTSLEAAGDSSSGHWSIVISGPRSAADGNQLGLVIYNGANDERAGLAAVSGWLSLEAE